jgi:hypothetical protein
MKSSRCLLTIFLCLLVLSCAKGGTYSLYLRYQPLTELSSLQQKIGSTLGMAPVKDERSDTLYIGRYTPLRGVLTYFKSDPFPLEKALAESLSHVISGQGVKITPVSNWDGKPESLQNMEADSVLMIEIKKFWLEGRARPFRTDLKVMIHFVIHLGVKKEAKVFTRNVEVDKEVTLSRLTPGRMEETVNGILRDVFDNFFSNPY